MTEIQKAPDRIKVLENIKNNEQNGLFNKDVEPDAPSKELLPHQIDYLRKNPINKLKARHALWVAHKFIKKLEKNNLFKISEIVGIENYNSLKTGVIITCNHFNPLDSFAMELLFESTNHFKHKKHYRIIKEANYTTFPGFYGYLMRNCNTLPLSSNRKTMEKFITSVNTLLQKGNFVLIYPEESMWWNYRKPRPLHSGAFRFAAKNNVPILPVFVTMTDTDVLGEDGFPIQAYKIHVSKPIFPTQNKPLKESIEKMKNENFKVWKNIYEEEYKTPLVYETLKTKE